MLVHRFDAGRLTMIGSGITFVALLVSSQMPRAGVLPFTYGALGGTTRDLSYISCTFIGPVLSTVLGPILAKIRPKTGLNTKNRFIKQS